MVNDLKVLVKSFNCEDRSCYAGNLRESFFCEFTKYFIYSQNFAKVGYLTAVGVFRRLTCHMLQRDAVLFSRRGSQEMWQGNEG